MFNSSSEPGNIILDDLVPGAQLLMNGLRRQGQDPG
jgi:hypothetical protein